VNITGKKKYIIWLLREKGDKKSFHSTTNVLSEELCSKPKRHHCFYNCSKKYNFEKN